MKVIDNENLRIDTYLSNELDISRSKIQKLIKLKMIVHPMKKKIQKNKKKKNPKKVKQKKKKKIKKEILKKKNTKKKNLKKVK